MSGLGQCERRRSRIVNYHFYYHFHLSVLLFQTMFVFQESRYVATKTDYAIDAETIDRQYWWHISEEF